ncbi:iron-sulfur cluster assembly accessory protein [Roseiarcaceae bacterium H3SJ34-1]|uniref:HesB/IscA family protein n=1 Tax=Terripilifer ovatus TaxID=3032367 RepID=UPI003AB94EFF|nr:iron-sulfur cluster assembly accessory protein [Roseiarcaceae bacterium H3SJ34-1]
MTDIKPSPRPSPRPKPKVMTLTDAAAARVREIVANAETPVVALRVGVKNGGCAGMSYTMDWAQDIGRFDEVVEEKGVKVIIDPKAILFLLGTEMDFRIDKLSSGFVFNNPNQTSACGCGESVALTPATLDDAQSPAN